MASVRLALLVVAAVLVAGCTKSGSSISADPEVVAEAAYEKLATSVGPTGDLRKMSGELVSSGGPLGEIDVTLALEFGKGDVVRLAMDVRELPDNTGFDGDVPDKLEVICTPTSLYFVIGSDAYQDRSIDMCTQILETGFEDQLLADRADLNDATTKANGDVEATFDDGKVTVLIRGGRIVELHFEDMGMEGTFTLEYGARQTIPLPDATRIPSSADIAYLAKEGSVAEASLYGTSPLAEIECRVFDGDALVATVPGCSGANGGYSFALTSSDDQLDGSDQLSITAPGDWTADHEVRIYDTWASAYTDDEVFAPGPFALVALLGAVFVVRRF